MIAEKPNASLAASLLKGMVRIRLVEEAIAANYGRQEMRCPVHLSIGQEAPAVGVCAALRDGDQVMSGHRSHAHYLAKGGSLNAMIAEMMGKETGCCKGRGGSMHLVDLQAGFVGAVPIVGSTIPIAVGLAFADKTLGRDRVTVAFLGDAATEEGVFHESVNFALLHKLPVLFICENNLYSVYSPLAVRQPTERSIADITAGHGMRSEKHDGNDPLAVYEATLSAAQHARSGKGPVLLELATYRWREHCGPGYDNHIGYRSEEEFLAWKAKDPIELQKTRMKHEAIHDAEDMARFEEEVGAEINEAFSLARSAPAPSADGLLKHLYH
ncbi:MAG: thiamine pyrophosphate-dependent dehydrogenase E1 component subunit alpha [Opitutaceae bacterium]|nr:thiamine pyrophosphate-dependent dehydrogenase E1 component subunit alpha [Opitutaceae bacterium]